VTHIDETATAALTDFYLHNLREGADVLDLCSSWISHFPKQLSLGRVVGVGMNQFELSKNVQLKEYIVQVLLFG
jgi:hypothetical protein